MLYQKFQLKITSTLNTIVIVVFSLLILLKTTNVYAQEFKNLKTYKIETGQASLKNGYWLKKDRKKQTKVWKQANIFNLSKENGNQKYKTISQIRDFYLWFDFKRKEQTHEIKGIGIAAVAACQLSKLDKGIIRFFIVRNHEVVTFANEGSKKVFEFAFPLLKKIYFSKKIIKGEEAKNWSLNNGRIEQCQILAPLYKKLSPKALHKLQRMAGGKGVFNLGVPNCLKYEGRIEDCNSRFEHAFHKILPYYLRHQKNKKIENQ
tara:strand:+ start:60720 stop:61505 length:786 start_codon:yes stop_codon:yes gene_type:complete